MFPLAVNMCVMSFLISTVGVPLQVMVLVLELREHSSVGEILRLHTFLWDLGEGVLYICVCGMAVYRYIAIRNTFRKSNKDTGQYIIIALSWIISFALAVSANATARDAVICDRYYARHTAILDYVYSLSFALTLVMMFVFYGMTVWLVHGDRLLHDLSTKPKGRSLSMELPCAGRPSLLRHEALSTRPVSADGLRKISVISKLASSIANSNFGLPNFEPADTPGELAVEGCSNSPSTRPGTFTCISPKTSPDMFKCQRLDSSMHGNLGGLNSVLYHSPRSRQVSSCSSSYSSISQISMGLEMRARRTSQNSLRDFSPSRQTYLGHSSYQDELQKGKVSLVDGVQDSPNISLEREPCCLAPKELHPHSPPDSVRSSLSSIDKDIEGSCEFMPANAPDLLQSAGVEARCDRSSTDSRSTPTDEDLSHNQQYPITSTPRPSTASHRCSIVSRNQLTPIVEGSRTSSLANLTSDSVSCAASEEVDEILSEDVDNGEADSHPSSLPPLRHARTHAADIPLRRLASGRQPSMAFLFQNGSDDKLEKLFDEQPEESNKDPGVGSSEAGRKTSSGSAGHAAGRRNSSSALITSLAITPEVGMACQRRVSIQVNNPADRPRRDSNRYAPYSLGLKKRRLGSTVSPEGGAAVAKVSLQGSSPTLRSSPCSKASSVHSRTSPNIRRLLQQEPPTIRLIRPSIEQRTSMSMMIPPDDRLMATLQQIQENPVGMDSARHSPVQGIPTILPTKVVPGRNKTFVTIRRSLMLVLHVGLSLGPLTLQRLVSSTHPLTSGQPYALLQACAYSFFALVPFAYVFCNKKMMKMIRDNQTFAQS